MPILPIPLGQTSRPGRFGPEGGTQLVNAYVEMVDGKRTAIYCRPGLTTFATPTTGGRFRGGVDLDTFGYFVLGSVVVKVDSAGSSTGIGSFGGSSHVFMARNRKSPNPQIAVVADGLRSIIENDVVTAITDPDLPAPVAVDTIGGFFVFPISDGRYFWTSIDEGTTVDALDFASAEANPDGLNGILARGQEIILFGPKSIEFHVLTGSASVFERVSQSTLQNLGCLSGAAAKSLIDVPVFPASDGTVRMLSGYSPERISNYDVERDIDELEDKGAMTALAFSMQGHQWYILNSTDWSWACDLTTRQWYQWKSANSPRWTVDGFVDVGGHRVAGNDTDNTLYVIDSEANSDNGEDIQWKVTTGNVGKFPNRMVCDELYANMLTGVGLNVATTEPEYDPQLLLRTSDDGGRTFSDEMEGALGKIGAFTTEVSYPRLGCTGEDGMRFELTASSQVSRALMGLSLRYTMYPP